MLYHVLYNTSHFLCYCQEPNTPALKLSQKVANHRGRISENVISFTEGLVVVDGSARSTLPKESGGCLGWGRTIDSLPRSTTTFDMVGLCSGFSCTHSSPMCTHLTISEASHDSNSIGSTKSNSFPSFHSLHACHG